MKIRNNYDYMQYQVGDKTWGITSIKEVLPVKSSFFMEYNDWLPQKYHLLGCDIFWGIMWIRKKR